MKFHAGAWIAAAVLAAAGAVAHENGRETQAKKARYLQASYYISTLSICLRVTPHPPSVSGMDPSTRRLLLPGQTTTQSGSGVMHFSRDGRARFKGRAAEVDLYQTAPGSVPSLPALTLTCNGTHSIAADNRFKLLATCTINDPASGMSFDVAPVAASGYISPGDHTIELRQEANMQVITFSLPDGTQFKSERVCTQRFTLSKLP